jgi:hypothetical protein
MRAWLSIVISLLARGAALTMHHSQVEGEVIRCVK